MCFSIRCLTQVDIDGIMVWDTVLVDTPFFVIHSNDVELKAMKSATLSHAADRAGCEYRQFDGVLALVLQLIVACATLTDSKAALVKS